MRGAREDQAWREGYDRFDEGESFGRHALARELLPLLKDVKAAIERLSMHVALDAFGSPGQRNEGGSDD